MARTKPSHLNARSAVTARRRPRKTRLTGTKPRSQSGVVLVPGGDPSGPTDEEWKTMKDYGSFLVHDPADGESHTFKLRHNALIVPEGVNPKDEIDLSDYWVGKIIAIRSRDDDPNEVWVRVQWYWSADEVAENVRRVDSSRYGKYERFLSDLHDYVHSTCFQGLTNVVPYEETDLDQKQIGRETFYYRHKYAVKAARITPAPRGSCICHKAYNPDDDDLMYFCPRSSCLKWYHLHCLLRTRWQESKPPEDRVVELEKTLYESTPSPPSRSQSHHHTRQNHSVRFTQNNYANIPPDLLAIARSSIVKGIAAKSIVGNMRSVIRAREIVQEFVGGKGAVPDDWKGQVSIEAWSKWKKAFGNETPICPSCEGTI